MHRLIILRFPCQFSSTKQTQMLIKSLCSTKKLLSPNCSCRRHSSILPRCTEPRHCKAFQQNRNNLIFSSKVWQTQKEAAKRANTRMSHAACAGAAEIFRETAFRERRLEQCCLQKPPPCCQRRCGCGERGTTAPHGWVQRPMKAAGLRGGHGCTHTPTGAGLPKLCPPH